MGKSRLTYEFTHSASGAGLADPGGRIRLLRQGHQLPARDRSAQGLLQDRRPGRPPGITPRCWGGCLAWTARSSPCCSPLLGAAGRAGRGPGLAEPGPAAAPPADAGRVKRLLLRRARRSRCWWSSKTCTGRQRDPGPAGWPGREPRSHRLLLLVTYRPEYEHRWGSKTAYSQLRLDSLPAESTAELLAALLGPDPGLAPLTMMLESGATRSSSRSRCGPWWRRARWWESAEPTG